MRLWANPRSSASDGAVDRLEENVPIDRLREIGDAGALSGFKRRPVVVRGDEDRRDLRAFGPQQTLQLEAGHVTEVDVDDEARRPLHDADAECVPARRERLDGKPRGLDEPPQRSADG